MGARVRLGCKIRCRRAAGWEGLGTSCVRMVRQGPPCKLSQGCCHTEGLLLARQRCGMTSAFWLLSLDDWGGLPWIFRWYVQPHSLLLIVWEGKTRGAMESAGQRGVKGNWIMSGLRLWYHPFLWVCWGSCSCGSEVILFFWMAKATLGPLRLCKSCCFSRNADTGI